MVLFDRSREISKEIEAVIDWIVIVIVIVLVCVARIFEVARPRRPLSVRPTRSSFIHRP